MEEKYEVSQISTSDIRLMNGTQGAVSFQPAGHGAPVASLYSAL